MPTKAGLSKYIDGPDKLWELFVQFMQWIEENPYTVKDWVGKDGDQVLREKQRPLTFIGFKKWLAINQVTSNLSDYETNKNGAYSEYSNIITRIKEICHGEIIEGAAAGMYNANIAARVTGLVEKQEQKIIQEQPLFPE
jgi:predicted ribonuclease toxin of YeeF-YezG toxin-antitoxin module